MARGLRARRHSALDTALLIALCCLGPAQLQASDESFQEHVKPLLKQYCYRCHTGDEPKGHLRLSDFAAVAQMRAARASWERVGEYLSTEIMPPEDEPQPADAERELLVGWIEANILSEEGDGRTPPPVTVRRLNRFEYRNTIRDLLGIDYEPAVDFPGDDVGNGFDNMGDVLTMPPVLMERYLTAAEAIAQQAIIADDPKRRRTQRFEAEDLLRAVPSGGAADGVFRLYSNGELFTEVAIAQAGRYLLRARSYAEQAGPETARMAMTVNGKRVHEFEVDATRGEAELYEIETELPAGQVRLGAAFTNDYFRRDAEEGEARDRNLAIDYLELDGPLGLEPTPLPAAHHEIIFCKPTPATRNQCLRDIVRRLATRAFRRPVDGREVSRLTRLVDRAQQHGASFERGLQLVLQAVLISPHFLYRVELPDDEVAKSGRALNDFQLATRLSYFLWSSMPDGELLELAAEDRLHEDGVLDAQIRRMLADEKAGALVDNFMAQWLTLRNLQLADPDPARFPEFDDDLRAAMLSETRLFCEAVVREDRSVLDFLDADHTFLNQRLAAHYGIAGVEGEEFRRVELADDARGGVLTQASILTVTSNPTRTSPVKRGKWVLEQLLGTPPPAPPPNVPELEAADGELSGTLREQMEQHRADPTCASCHKLMDPLGFGLENFDAIGRWRDREGEQEIDASGELPSGEKFFGPGELRQVLLSRAAEFRRALAEKMLVYALGRGLVASDQQALEGMVAQLEAGDDRFSALVLAIAQSAPFHQLPAGGRDE